MSEHYTDHWEEGMYRCSRCGTQLFPSTAKFKSGTRWPSFREAIPGSLTIKPDHSAGMERTEILCAHCGLHLGHVFDDGVVSGDTHPEAGQRFCVLSDALQFEDQADTSKSKGQR